MGERFRDPTSHGGCWMSMIETLPAWLKSARHRGDVLAATALLEARLADPGRAAGHPRRAPVRPDPRRMGAAEFRYC